MDSRTETRSRTSKEPDPKTGSQFYSCMEPQPRFLEKKKVFEKNNYNRGLI
jgi:hypothetical protein